jgi:hypothetical protein
MYLANVKSTHPAAPVRRERTIGLSALRGFEASARGCRSRSPLLN